MEGEEVGEGFSGEFWGFAGGVRRRAVELFRWVSESFLEYSQHLLSFV